MGESFATMKPSTQGKSTGAKHTDDECKEWSLNFPHLSKGWLVSCHIRSLILGPTRRYMGIILPMTKSQIICIHYETKLNHQCVAVRTCPCIESVWLILIALAIYSRTWGMGWLWRWMLSPGCCIMSYCSFAIFAVWIFFFLFFLSLFAGIYTVYIQCLLWTCCSEFVSFWLDSSQVTA